MMTPDSAPSSADGQSSEKSTEMIRGSYIALRRRGRWEYVTRPNAKAVVAVIALTPAEELVLIEQYRPPVGARVLEIPAGLVGDEAASADESLLEAAHRELEEETGYIAGRWRQVAVGPPSAGLSDEVVTFYLARDIARSGSGGGVGDEDITVHYTTRGALGAFVAERAADGVLIDPKVYAAAWFAWGDPAEESQRNRTVPEQRDRLV